MVEIENGVIAPANGALGSALGIALIDSGLDVTFAFRDKEKTERFIKHHRIERLKGIVFPNEIKATEDTAQAVKNADLVVLATPAEYLPTYYKKQIMPFRRKDRPVLCVTKGLVKYNDQYLTPAEVLLSVDPSLNGQLAVLSGPDFAREIAQHKPFATVIASENSELAELLVGTFARNLLMKVYASTDVKGVLIGGALKNVIAIAAGVCDGRKLGENARTALIVRGNAEIINLGVKFGAQRETLEGLSGYGDLLMTCTSMQSRNHEFGVGIGRGKDPLELLKKFSNNHKTVEGYETARVARELAKRLKVRTPIINSVYLVLHKGYSVDAVINGLMENEMIYENGTSLANGSERKKWYQRLRRWRGGRH